jgi:competence protein ComEA
MLKKLLLAVATLIATMGIAFAQVDVNKADQAALDGIKGIGPAMSKRILDERKKGGDFKNWADLEQRVKGIRDKRAAKLSAAGLTVNGQAFSGGTSVSEAKTEKKEKSGKSAKKDMKS